MNKIDSGYNMGGDVSRERIYYAIRDDGFEIYLGQNAEYPTYMQTESYIPNPDISYEENAINYVKSLAVPARETIDKESADLAYASTEDITNLRSDIDYLMLLNDADTATEEETE